MEIHTSLTNSQKTMILEVTFFTPRVGQWTYSFSHNVGHPVPAGQILNAIEEQFAERVRKIRRDAYNEGWKDKTRRKRKKTEFEECFNSNVVGY